MSPDRINDPDYLTEEEQELDELLKDQEEDLRFEQGHQGDFEE